MSFPSYEKNYEVGSVRLDAPYAEFVYELPLLSFGDVLHTVNLSLTYQSKMSGNPYNIAEGFGLNLHKRLISYQGTAYVYESGNGETVDLNENASTHVSIFSDGSQRIIRPVNGNLVLENPDYSTEVYREGVVNSHNIVSANDKYGHVILEYTYTGDRLDSIAYRPGVTNKKIVLAYNSSNALESISYYTGSIEVCKTNLVYLVSGGIKVQHYSGVDYYVIPNGASFTAYSRDYSATELKNYYHSIECNISTNSSGIKTITTSALVGVSIVDSTTFKFYSPTNNKIVVMDVTDFHGVTTRTQYMDDKPAYSYEVLETMFVNETVNGVARTIAATEVSVYKEGSISGRHSYNDGLPLSHLLGNNWRIDLYSEFLPSKNFMLTGWFMSNVDDPNTEFDITINNYTKSKQTTAKIKNLCKGQFIYVQIPFSMDLNGDIQVIIDHPITEVLCTDLRLFCFDKTAVPDSYTDHFTDIHNVLFDDEHSGTRVIFNNGSRFYIGTEELDSTTYPITPNDIAKYIINQMLGTHKNEIYYNNCRGVISNAGAFTLEYPVNEDGDTETCNIASAGFGKIYRRDTDEYVAKTFFTVLNGGLLCLKTVDTKNGTIIKEKVYDTNLDLKSEMDGNGISIEYTRNSYGLITEQKMSAQDTSEEIITSAIYTSDYTGLTTTDEFGIITSYNIDPTWGGVTESYVQKNGGLERCSSVKDCYDDDFTTHKNRVFESLNDTADKSHSFRYCKGSLTGLSDGYNGYRFTYSDRGDLHEVRKNSVLLETHTVSEERLNFTTDYGIYSFTEKYDKYGRFVEKTGYYKNTYDLNPTETNGSFSTLGKDNGSAKLASTTDLVKGQETKFAYDNGKLVKAATFNSSNTKLDERTLTYDKINRVTEDKFVYDVANGKYVEDSCIYDRGENSPLADGRKFKTYYKVGASTKIDTTSSYDDLKRLSTKNIYFSDNTLTKDYFYTNYRPYNVRYTLGNEKIHDFVVSYNERGQLSAENDYSQNYNNIDYKYDTFGQLIREDNRLKNKTIVYSYDTAGNITSAKEYAYTEGEITGEPISEDVYVYDSIRTKLTSFNGGGITYNSDGCAITYNKDGTTVSYGWQNGKLISLSSHNFTTDQYNYDGYGRRVKKTHFITTEQKVVTNYTYDHKGRLIRESWDDKEITYLYDEMDVVGMIYDNGDEIGEFLYVKNPRGDVIGIYDSDGNVAAKYSYDAWGNCAIVNATNAEVATINRIRYRSYYLDLETKFYYLNARYYNPEWRRFISPDSVDYLDPDVPNGLNPYAYCYNDPVNYVDPSGHSVTAAIIIGVLVGATIGGAVGGTIAYNQAVDNGATGLYLFSQTLDGVIKGAIAGGIIGYLLGSYAPAIGAFMSTSFPILLPEMVNGAIGLTVAGTITGAELVGGAIGIGVSLFSLGADRFKPKNIGSNTSQNKFIDHLQDKYGFGDKVRRRLHDKITKRGYSNKKVEEVLRKMLGLD